MSAEIDVQAGSPSFLIPHTYPGRLVAAEGLDGSGKNTWLESFRNFEIKMYSEYQSMQKEFGFIVIVGNQFIDQVQAALRHAIAKKSKGKK